MAKKCTKKRDARVMHDYHVKMPNFAFYREKKTSNDKNFFVILNSDMVSKNSIPGGFAYICQNKCVGIIPITT